MENLVKQLRRLSIERRPEACLSCGFERGCSVHGCAVIKRAAEIMEAETADEMFREMGYIRSNNPNALGAIYKNTKTAAVIFIFPDYAFKGVSGQKAALSTAEIHAVCKWLDEKGNE